MAVRPADKIHFAMEGYSTEAETNEKSSSENKAAPSSFQSQIFSQDIYENFPTIEILSTTVELEAKTPSFWSKIFGWWYQPEIKAQSAPSSASENDLLEVDEVEPISPVPVIDEPEGLPADLNAAKLPPALRKTNKNEKKLSHRELMEALSQMSDRTIEQIMFIILQAQMELEKENANIAEGTFTKYQDFKKLQESVLQDIQDVLRKDEKIAGWLKTGQNIAIAAGVICGVAAAAVSFGVVPAAGGAAIMAVNALGSYGAVVATGIVTGMTKISNIYFKKRFNDDKAKHEQFKHQDQYYTDRMDDSRSQLMAIAESDNVFKDRLINLFKRFQRMCKLVSER